MKTLNDLINNVLPDKNKKIIVELIAVVGGWRELDKPTLAEELKCLVCGETDYYAPFADPNLDKRRVWICADGSCASNQVKNWVGATTTQTPHTISVPWPLFCEIHGIGDVHHNVRFEDIHQSKAKISYMLDFLQKPHGIIYMQGEPGTGKTYCAMGMCQFFLRKETSCYFATQAQFLQSWLDSRKENSVSNFIDKVYKVKLLVIDDFGTGEISAGFMKFFLDLINSRMQWTDRGTVLTTNLMNDKLAEFCGEALTDRIRTGQLFKFQDKQSRRPKPL